VAKTPPVNKNDVVELEVADLALGGLGVANMGGYVIFVENALPGDRVKARITRRQANHSQASIVEIMRPAPERTSAPCILHDTCGGCVWQTLPYEQQLVYKQRHVAEALKHIGGQEALPIQPILPSPKMYHYRNKMEFSFGKTTEGAILGFHYPGWFDRIFEVNSCLIQPEIFDDVLAVTQRWARQSGIPPYDPRSHEGILRSLILRRSEANGQWLACLLTKSMNVDGHLEELASALDQAADGFAGLLWAFNDGLADVARMDAQGGVVGDPIVEEHLEEFRFRVSPFSFFQTNTLGAELLYRQIRDFVGLTGNETLLDAYCGTGSIGIFCSRGAKRIYGVEIVRDAVWDARANAVMNDVKNCTFIAAPMSQGLNLVRDAGGRHFDRIIIDPPRGGMDKKSLKHLLECRAPVFVYVSCNPATLSRDVISITEAGYRIANVQPVDLFPHTHHIETVIRFERASIH